MQYLKVKIYVNPICGAYLGNRAMKLFLAEEGRMEGVSLSVAETRPHDFLNEIEQATRQYRLIAFCGGDTTARIAAIAAKRFEKAEVDFALIPLGTENDLAAALGASPLLTHGNITKVLPRVLRRIIEGGGKRVSFDIIDLSRKAKFVGTSAFGFDAEVSCCFHRFRTTRTGNAILKCGFMSEFVYFWIAIARLFRRRDFRNIKIRLREEGSDAIRNIDVPQKLLSVLVTNGSHYGGAKISNSSIINDGYFEITIVKSFRELATIFLNKFFKSLTARLDDLEQYHVDYLEIHIPANRYEFHLDGDSFTEHFSTENKLIYRVSDTTQLVVP